MQSSRAQFVGRQPIFNRDNQVFAYELLYRNSKENRFPAGIDDETATNRVIFDSLLLHNIETLSRGLPVFLNLSTDALIGQLPNFTCPNKVVIEITERTKKLRNVEWSIKSMKKKHYKFALDDYDGNEKWNNILDDVDFIKLEVESPIANTVARVQTLRASYPNKKIIVERIEDNATYQALIEAGCDYFQGYFFKRPEVLELTNIAPSKLTALHLLANSESPSFDILNVSKDIEKDLGLTVRVLKLANTLCRMKGNTFSSIRHAVTYVGETMIRQFIKMISMSVLSDGKSPELFSVSLFRAKFIGEILAIKDPALSDSGYLIGLVSLLDAIMDVEFSDILKELNLSAQCTEALMNHEGLLGSVFLLCKQVENSEWENIETVSRDLSLSLEQVNTTYRDSMAYADKLLRSGIGLL